VTAAGWAAPLRAYDAAGALRDRIDTPDTRLVESTTGLVVARGTATLQWTPATRQLVPTGDRPSCPGAAVRGSTDGAVVLIADGARLLACRPRDRTSVELALGAELQATTKIGRAVWVLDAGGRRAAAIDRDKLAVFDTLTGKPIALPARVAELTITEVALAPATRLALAAKEGLFLVEGDGIRQLEPAAARFAITFADDATLVGLTDGRMIAWDLADQARYELGMVASPDDARTALRTLGPHAIASTLHLRTGVAVVFPITPPDPATVSGWLARVGPAAR
jgi:hypothetical protein